MEYIDHHAHMVNRTTDDYQQMALTGCVAVSEPAFWAGFDRASAAVFEDYFNQLTCFEPKRAAKYGIKHYTWIGLNPKESDDRSLAREVLPLIPRYLERPDVIGVGEIGLNRVTRNERDTFVEQVDLAIQYRQLILIHTPHLEDKYKGTKVIIDALRVQNRVEPGRVMIDHVEEHTIAAALEAGFWAGITLYPQTKTSAARAIDMIEMHGSDRICIASACDWGPSLPIAVPYFVLEMRRRGHSEELIHKVVYENPIRFLSQSPKFQLLVGAR